MRHHWWIVAVCALVLCCGFAACEDDDGSIEPHELPCLSERWGVVEGDHVHGRARVCGEDLLLESYETRPIEIPAGEAGHAHAIWISGSAAQRIFDGEQVFLNTMDTRYLDHVHRVVFNKRPDYGGAPGRSAPGRGTGAGSSP